MYLPEIQDAKPENTEEDTLTLHKNFYPRVQPLRLRPYWVEGVAIVHCAIEEDPRSMRSDAWLCLAEIAPLIGTMRPTRLVERKFIKPLGGTKPAIMNIKCKRGQRQQLAGFMRHDHLYALLWLTDTPESKELIELLQKALVQLNVRFPVSPDECQVLGGRRAAKNEFIKDMDLAVTMAKRGKVWGKDDDHIRLMMEEYHAAMGGSEEARMIALKARRLEREEMHSALAPFESQLRAMLRPDLSWQEETALEEFFQQVRDLPADLVLE